MESTAVSLLKEAQGSSNQLGAKADSSHKLRSWGKCQHPHSSWAFSPSPLELNAFNKSFRTEVNESTSSRVNCEASQDKHSSLLRPKPLMRSQVSCHCFTPRAQSWGRTRTRSRNRSCRTSPTVSHVVVHHSVHKASVCTKVFL